jgi:hypothetical protein
VPSAERLAKNESMFREVNERIGEVSERFGTQDPEGAGFICECSRETCLERLQLTRHEYESARTSGRRFLLVPGHEDLSHEVVVSRTPRYALVEKRGEAGVIAAQLNTR